MGITRRQNIEAVIDRISPVTTSTRRVSVEPAPSAKWSLLAGVELAWLLLFPSLGLVQKYLGTTATVAYFGLGSLFFVVLSARGLPASLVPKERDRRWISFALVALYAVLVGAFVILYPLANSHAPSIFHGVAEGGSDRDESLNLGVRALLAGHYPYYEITYLNNPVTQLPGSLLLAVPFALFGDAVWQNLFWLAAFLGVTRYVFGGDRLTIGFVALTVVGSPAVFHDFITGGDLGVNAIVILVGMLSIMRLAPDVTASSWKKVGAAVFTGIALSSRLNYLLLVPPLFAAVARRAGLRDAFVCVLTVGLAFTAVTVPFYWHDPGGFAPLSLHNKFIQFDGLVPTSRMLFPILSLLFSVIVALSPGNRAVSVWLIQCGLVIALPAVFLVGLATIRSHAPNFVFTDYALAGVFFGGMGGGLHMLRSESI